MNPSSIPAHFFEKNMNMLAISDGDNILCASNPFYSLYNSLEIIPKKIFDQQIHDLYLYLQQTGRKFVSKHIEIIPSKKDSVAFVYFLNTSVFKKISSGSQAGIIRIHFMMNLLIRQAGYVHDTLRV